MNAAFAAGLSAVACVLYWTIAVHAATRRGLKVGTLPPMVPVLAAAATYAATLAGMPAAAVVASAGVAVAGVVDARTGFIFDPLTLAIIAPAFVLAALGGSATDGLFGAAAAGGALLLLRTISRGRGLGLGDVKLAAALGGALGLASGLTAIGLAFIFGGAYGAWLLASGRARAGTPIRFGPFIAAGTYAALLAPLGTHQ